MLIIASCVCVTTVMFAMLFEETYIILTPPSETTPYASPDCARAPRDSPLHRDRAREQATANLVSIGNFLETLSQRIFAAGIILVGRLDVLLPPRSARSPPRRAGALLWTGRPTRQWDRIEAARRWCLPTVLRCATAYTDGLVSCCLA